MSRLLRLRFAASASVVLLLPMVFELGAWSAPETHGRDVEVRLADGRLLIVDRISPQTNRHRLAVSVVSPRIQLTRFLPWIKVTGVRVGGRLLSRDDVIRRFGTSRNVPETTHAMRVASHTAFRVSGNDRPAGPALQPMAVGRKSFPLQPVPTESYSAPGEMAFGRSPCGSVPACAPCYGPRSIVIGVREDPLKAYGEALRKHFSDGVPLLEIPFALELVRQEKLREVLWSPVPSPPVPAELLPARPSPPSTQQDDAPARSPAPLFPSSRRGRSATEGRGQPVALAQPRPERIGVRAHPVSTGGRSDWDSLELELVGLDRHGVAVPLRGTLQATLWGMPQRIIPVNANEILFDSPARPGPMVSAAMGAPVRLADWTRALESPRSLRPAVSSDRFGAAERSDVVARVLLPLPRPLPDHNAKLAPFGSLHVRLLMPGVGQFEATVPEVQLQQTGSIRALQTVTTGSRFLPTETTSDRRHWSPVPFLPRPASPPRPFPFLLD